MRTSGEDRDTVILLIPMAMLAVLMVMMAGGPNEFLRQVDQTVVDSIQWIVRQWS